MASTMSGKTETATLGGGCFWCVEGAFAEVEGVASAVSGYAGGTVADPTYEQVCSGATGHAEVVQVTFDPDVITYREILEIFFSVHDPTTPDRQGPDVGTQYRSIILTHSPEQEKTAKQVIGDVETEGVWDDPIVTQVEPLKEFYRAEDYHQGYYKNNTTQPYCFTVVRPKLAKFRKRWAHRLKAA
jgi:peptide-methionine (S)-S-oxide reductase